MRLEQYDNKVTISGVFLYFFISRKRKEIIRKNINYVFKSKSKKEKKRLALAFSSHLFQFLKELVFFRRYKKKITLEMEGEYNLANALKKSKGVFILSIHMGNWELILPLLAEKLYFYNIKWNCIRKPLKPRSLQKIIFSRFKKSGIDIILNKGGARKILRALKRNEIVVYNIDQSTNSTNGLASFFFNRKVFTYSSLAELQAQYNTPIIPAYMYRKNRKTHVAKFLPELEHSLSLSVEKRTQEYNGIIEKIILKYPEQWYCWIHDRWKLKQ